MSRSSAPSRFVPTLTEVVLYLPSQTPFAAEIVAPVALPAELMLQRVMQRVDLVLERRLREAVEQLILEHTQTLIPRLREEIELVVRQSVTQAFEQEASPSQSHL